jgi:hypothetical protein
VCAAPLLGEEGLGVVRAATGWWDRMRLLVAHHPKPLLGEEGKRMRGEVTA